MISTSESVNNYILIPFWIEKAIIRNNFDINDLLNYAKLRTIINQEDAFEFLALQSIESFTIDLGIDHTGHLFNCWRDTANASQIPELDSVLVPLSHSKDVQAEIIKRLSLEYSPIVSSGDSKRFKCNKLSRDVTFITLESGFTEYISETHSKFVFIQTLMKSLYVYFNVTEASFSNLFAKYVRTLEQSLRPTLAT